MVAPFPQFVNISDCLGLWKARQGHHLKTQRAQNQWALEKRQVEVHERSHIKDKESIHFLLYKRHLSMSYDQISYFQQVSFRTIFPPWPRLHKSDSSSRSTNQPILRRARAPACHCPNGSMPRSMWDRGSSPSMEVFINKINKTSSCEGWTGWLVFATACSALYVRLLAGEFGSAIDLYMYTVYIYIYIE